MKRQTVTLTKKKNSYYAMEHVQPKLKFKIGDVVAFISDFEIYNTRHEVHQFVDAHIVIGIKLKNKHGKGYWEYELHSLGEYHEDELTWHPCPNAKKIRGFGYILPAF